MFRFKQFTIHQERSAMKVTTDACLFGAWVAQRLESKPAYRSMLDIGGGTGLLSLMVAQQNPGLQSDAIEIDPAACREMSANFLGSPWPDRLHAIPGDAAQYPFRRRYDVVLSNPPFYEKELSSPLPGRDLAHHGGGIRLAKVLELTGRLLEPGGVFFLLLPFKRETEIRTLLKESGLGVSEIVLVKHSPAHAYSRILVEGNAGGSQEIRFGELSIRDEAGNYSADFRSLLEPYYL